MFCEKCGAKNDSSSKFCEKCGAKLDGEVKETKKKTTAKNSKKKTEEVKAEVKETEPKKETPTKTSSKNKKVIGGLVVVVAIILVAGYVYLSKANSLESFASRAFEQLSSKQTISDKYLKEPLDSDDYFVSLGDTMKSTIKENDIILKNKDYEVKAGNKKVRITYRDSKKKDKYKVTFTVDTDGKTLGLFDKYIITKIEIENETENDTYTLYNPKKTSDATISTLKGVKVVIDGKEIGKKYISKKDSDDDTDVYKIKGISEGKHTFAVALDKLQFKKDYTIYSKENDIDMTSAISSYYLDKDTTGDYADAFKEYINTYYEYIVSGKSFDDFKSKYDTNENIERKYSYSKDNQDYYKLTSFKVTSSKIDSLYYYKSDSELSITYGIKYTYERDGEKYDKTTTISATYDIKDLKTPKTLGYLPM